jgi:hypothetical protein
MNKQGSSNTDLKSREYRDKNGEIHHHTHPYMDEHGAKGEQHQRGPRAREHDGSGHAAHALTDHDEIRQWAESRGGKPACVKGTGGKGDPGMIRLDFPGYSGEGSLQPISWSDWFKSFDENDLALLVQEQTASGQESHFNKLVARETAEGRQQSRRSGHH